MISNYIYLHFTHTHLYIFNTIVIFFKLRWHFIKSEQIVIVKTGNTELPKDSFLVYGFDVQGKMLNDGQSSGDIGFLLLNKKGVSKYSHIF